MPKKKKVVETAEEVTEEVVEEVVEAPKKASKEAKVTKPEIVTMNIGGHKGVKGYVSEGVFTSLDGCTYTIK